MDSPDQDTEYSPAPPPGWWQPPEPPRQRARAISVIVIFCLVFAAAFYEIPRLIFNPNVAAVESAIVYITGELPTGNSIAGTGLIIDSSGDVLTNNHVVDGVGNILARTNSSGKTYAGRLLGVDVAEDIAVIRLSGATGLLTAPVGNSDKLNVGEQVSAVGNALGRGRPAVTQGHISALNQTVTPTDETGNRAETLTGMIEFDGLIQPGDSGGALVDGSGSVIGMNTAGSGNLARVFNKSQGFAIPINAAMGVARQIVAGKASSRVEIGSRGILGVNVEEGSVGGAAVVGVQTGGPADRAGITANDEITAIDGRPINSVGALTVALNGKTPGTRVGVDWTDPSGAGHHATLVLAAGPLN